LPTGPLAVFFVVVDRRHRVLRAPRLWRRLDGIRLDGAKIDLDCAWLDLDGA
jgi:hypothetical protein